MAIYFHAAFEPLGAVLERSAGDGVFTSAGSSNYHRVLAAALNDGVQPFGQAFSHVNGLEQLYGGTGCEAKFVVRLAALI